MNDAWRSFAAGAVLIVLLTVVAYVPAMRGGFIWDDDAYVTGNQTLRSAQGLHQIWLNPKKTVQYYPLTFTVFWIEYQLWGLNPFGFHLVNVLLQAANAILLWRLLSGLRAPGAWWAAAIFALHPVHVMSVAWITELKNVLSGFFYLAALLAYVRFCGLDGHGGMQQPRLKRFYGLALALYACALLSKTSTSIFPVAILLILWWKQGYVRWKELAAAMPFVVMGILLGTFTLWLEKYEKGASSDQFMLPFLPRVLLAGRSFWFCLGRLLWPAELTFIYPRWHIDPTVMWSYLYPLGATALLAALWWARRRLGRAPLAGMIYFALAFPMLVIIQMLFMMQYSFVSDHWQYLGSMGVIPLGVGATVTVLNRSKPGLRKLGFGIGTIVLAGLGLLTSRQGHIYRDTETLWRDTLAKNPNAWMAHNNLGLVLASQGKTAEAIAEYRASLEINPDNVEAYNDLGVALAGQGKLAEAMAEYRAALRINPDDTAAHNNLGNILARQGRLDQAVAEYQAALRIKPEFVQARHNLGRALADLGKLPEAMAEYRAALRINPDDTAAHNNLGNILARQGRLDKAAVDYQAVLRIRPDNVEAHYNLGNVLASQGRVAEAMAQYRETLRLRPDWPPALSKLAWILATDGNTSVRSAGEAVQLAERLCAVTGSQQADALDVLAAAYAEAGRFSDAIRVAQQAVELARAAGQQELARQLQERLQLYQAGRPFREKSPPPS
ncbi:MAG: tetratricopeptide repeat protein [Verrucomicrobiia bacterium]